jgi:hypothetical protein
MKTENNFVGVLRRGKADDCFRGDVVRGRVEFGIDDVTGDYRSGLLGFLREKWKCNQWDQCK